MHVWSFKCTIPVLFLLSWAPFTCSLILCLAPASVSPMELYKSSRMWNQRGFLSRFTLTKPGIEVKDNGPQVLRAVRGVLAPGYVNHHGLALMLYDKETEVQRGSLWGFINSLHKKGCEMCWVSFPSLILTPPHNGGQGRPIKPEMFGCPRPDDLWCCLLPMTVKPEVFESPTWERSGQTSFFCWQPLVLSK